MQQQGLNKWFATATLLLSVFSFGAMAEVIEKKFEVAPGGTLDLRTQSGSVKILTHKASTVLLEVELRGDDTDLFELSTDVSGNDVEVIGEVKGRGWNRDLRIKFEVTVPENYNVEVDTSGGSIGVEDLIGNVDVRTSGGSIKVGSVKGRVKLHTSGGSIQTEEIYGPLNAHTSGGSIRATFAEQLTEDATLDTSGGSIVAYLVPEAKVDLDASTSGGRVKTDFDVNGRIKKQSIRGEINGGGPELQLHTSGGSVTVRSL